MIMATPVTRRLPSKFIFDRKLKNFQGYNVARTVSIESNNCPTITAITLYPCRFLSGRERFIKLLGNKSLGAYILNPRRFKKYYVSYKIIQNEIHRIVVYIFKNKKILVDEIFPMFFRYKDLSLLQARRKFWKILYLRYWCRVVVIHTVNIYWLKTRMICRINIIYCVFYKNWFFII